MLTRNQQHYIRSLLAHIENEVQEGMAMLEGADPDALFPHYADYPDTRRIDALRAHLARLRSIMRRFMDAQGMAKIEQPTVDASWGFQTRMTMAGNAVFELGPNYVRGYGGLDEQGEQDCRALCAELGLLLNDVARELGQQPLVLPPEHSKEALLSLLVDVIERHHLLELRSSVQGLFAGQAGDCVEVAMLGRVSSGKSSLVNALLGQPMLPVGAIPVTSVVTRIRHGEALLIKAIDVEGGAQDVVLENLPHYIAESGNADNHRRLREVMIEMPAAILQGGIVLTDTPGLGSLHAKASAHALSYLPRCDLGIITIDASATLSQQDVDLARALQQARASRLVLLTKSDTVSADALEQQRLYIQHELSQALQEPVEITEISVHEGHACALQHWRDGALQDALTTCARQHRTRAQQRLADLARRVCAVLEQALKEHPDVAPATGSATGSATASGHALATLSDIESHLRTLCSDLGHRGAAVVLNDALPAIVADASDILSPVRSLAAQLADEVVREMLSGMKSAAKGLDDQEVASLLRGVPPFVLALPRMPTRYEVSGPRVWRQYRLRKSLQDDFQQGLQNTFLAYARELKNWLAQVSRSLRQALGGDILATRVTKSAEAAIRADLERIQALMGEAPGVSSSDQTATS